jgi:hypothetical protein
MIITNYAPEDLKKLPLRAIVALSARCARRVEHLAVPEDDDPETQRCRAAVSNAIRLTENVASGSPCPSPESAAFTAAFEAVAAIGHSDSFITAAIDDYEKLLRLELGKYPEAGEPVDPSSKGQLGSLAV